MQKGTLHMDLYIICRTNHKTEPKGICYMIGPNETATVELVKSCFQKERGKLLRKRRGSVIPEIVDLVGELS